MSERAANSSPGLRLTGRRVGLGLLLALFVALGAKLLFTPVKGPPMRSEFTTTIEHARGWPWVYSRNNEIMWDRNPTTWHAFEFSYFWLLADMAVLTAMVAIGYVFAGWYHASHGAWL